MIWFGSIPSRWHSLFGGHHGIVVLFVGAVPELDVNMESWNLPPVIWAAIAPGEDAEALQLLIQQRHANVNATGWFQESLLHAAVGHGKLRRVMYLLQLRGTGAAVPSTEQLNARTGR